MCITVSVCVCVYVCIDWLTAQGKGGGGGGKGSFLFKMLGQSDQYFMLLFIIILSHTMLSACV